MAFTTKQLMYLLTRVKRGIRPRLAPALAAVPNVGKRGAVGGAVDLAFTKPYGAVREFYPVPHGRTKIVDARRRPVGSIDWHVYDEGKHLHISSATTADYGLGRWSLGASNVRRLLNQFKGYTGGMINRVTGYRISGVRGQVPKDTTVPIPHKGVGLPNREKVASARRVALQRQMSQPGGPPVTELTPAGTHMTYSAPHTPRRIDSGLPPGLVRGRVSGWNPPSAEEMKRRAALRLPQRLERRHFQQVAAEIHNWASSAPNRLGTVEHQEFARVAANRLAETNPRFDRRRFIRAAMTGTDIRQEASVGGFGGRRRRR